jgi:hypothetical protein
VWSPSLRALGAKCFDDAGDSGSLNAGPGASEALSEEALTRSA